MERMFRLLKADEIDCRVATVNEKGCTLLLYKDARVDQNILDETVGPFNWQRKHEIIDGNLYCSVGIFESEFQQWVWKQDVGTESYTEKEKGQASDSFKRACFNWGIGRELYTAPFTWVSAGKANIVERNGKYTTYDRFLVKTIGYDKDGNINKLTIINAKTEAVVFTFGAAETEEEKMAEKGKEKISDKELKAIRKVIEGDPEKYSEDGICRYFKIEKLEDMTVDQMVTFNKKRGKEGK